jgi:biotin carboxyl carrier protein
MKLRAAISDNEHDLSLDFVAGLARAVVDGRHYEIDVREVGQGQYLLASGGKIYKCRVEHDRYSSHEGAFAVTLRGRDHNVVIVDPKRLRSGQSSAAHHSGAAEIVSPMPGKIVRVLVAAGANVVAGDGVIVVEAMKMQNEMKAPKAGVVVSINAEEGATVNAGDVLAVIE